LVSGGPGGQHPSPSPVVVVVANAGLKVARIGGGDDPYWKHLEETKKKWEKKQEELENNNRPLLNSINAMRAKLCWTRQDFWHNRKCIKFLGILCREGSTGFGVCSRFAQDAQKRCDHPDTRLKREYCPMLERWEFVREGEEEKEEGADMEDDMDDQEENNAEVADEVQKNRREKRDKLPPDTDNDGIPDSDDPDLDNDGVANDKDAFPNNSKDWNDMDRDGIGDNSDEDRDGDGFNNVDDDFPDDPTRPDDVDKDGDGVADYDDAFPDDPTEWSDRDGDGHGDQIDEFPDNANCWKSPCVDPDDVANTMNKVERGLPPDGYDEHTPGLVEHDDMHTSTDDWQDEYPRHSEDTREATMQKLCAEEPDNTWCKRLGYS